jgi:alkylation response protein AidB-like acyl-CoA dehydrogenase
MSELEAYRREVRAWLASMTPKFASQARRGRSREQDLAAARAYQRTKFEAGHAGISWERDVGGQGLSPLHKMIFEQEEARCDLPTGYFGVSLGIVVPIVLRLAFDREWARERAAAALRGDEIWCQLFSEPSAGSDLAAVRTKAEPCEGGWRLEGQKLWTTMAQYADYGIILARSDPALPKHKGLTFFWIDMRAPGVTVRPIRLASGDEHVNEVFFDDVVIGDAQRLSPVGGGFAAAMATLMVERYAAGDPAAFGPPLEALIALARESEIGGRPALDDGRIRSAIARAYALRSGLEAITTRAMRSIEAGMEPGPEGSLNKLLSVRGRQRLSELAIDLMGCLGLTWDRDAIPREDWVASWLDVPTLRIAGGTDEMLLNTIAEKVLALPQDHRPDKAAPFRDPPRANVTSNLN